MNVIVATRRLGGTVDAETLQVMGSELVKDVPLLPRTWARLKLIPAGIFTEKSFIQFQVIQKEISFDQSQKRE